MQSGLDGAAAERLQRTRCPLLLRIAAVCGQVVIGAGCAELLGLPDDPHLAGPAVPDPAATSALGMVPNSSDSGTSSSVGMPDSVGTGNNVSKQPERDPIPTDVAEPGGSMGMEEPVPRGPADAGLEPSATPDSAVIEPAPVCGDGSVEGPNGNCYAVGTSELGWLEARAACRERGAAWDLAAVLDAETNLFLTGLFSGEAWLGGSDANVEGNWRWVRDGLAFWSGDATGGSVNGAFANWNSDEPNGDDDSDCVRMTAATRRWADLECEELRLPLCEGPKS